MPDVPVLCRNCEALFSASILEGAILENTLIGNKPVPYPFCGYMGNTIEGLYSTVGETVQIIANSLRSEKSLSLLAKKLKHLIARETEPSLFKQEIQQDVPELKSIADTLPNTRSELYAFIAIILGDITMLISIHTQFSRSSQSITKENVEEIVKEAMDKTIEETALQSRKNKME